MTIQNILLVLLGIAIIILIFIIGSSVKLWIQALVSGAKVGLLNIVFMRLRKVSPKLIVESKIMAVKAGLDISTNDLESHYLAGGNVNRVVKALIAADKANIELDFNRAAAIDLAGRNVLEAVQMSVNPKVIETPKIAAMAKDGIQLKAISRVTVRTNIEQLVGGAGEETIIARVGEGGSTAGSLRGSSECCLKPVVAGWPARWWRPDDGVGYCGRAGATALIRVTTGIRRECICRASPVNITGPGLGVSPSGVGAGSYGGRSASRTFGDGMS